MTCIIIDKDKKTRTIIEEFVNQTTAFQLLKSCSSAEEALKVLLNQHVDVVFLDISMSGMEEVEFMQRIDHDHKQLIVIADSEKFAREAFDFDVTDYLLRPITWERFLKAISKARRLLQTTNVSNGEDEVMFIKENSSLIKIKIPEVYYIKSTGDYVTIKTSDQKYVVHETLKKLADRFNGSFLRVHQSFIINLSKIERIEKDSIAMDNILVPVGRTYKKELTKRLKIN